MKYIIAILMIIYLVVQSKMDIKNMYVSVPLNYIAIGINIILYLTDCIKYGFNTTNIVFILGMFIGLIILTKIKVLGSGDAKGIFAIMLALRYYNSTGIYVDAFQFFIFLFIANVALLVIAKVPIFNGIKRKIEGNTKYIAFFPCLCFAYIITILPNMI